jgi:hypothetical protein
MRLEHAQAVRSHGADSRAVHLPFPLTEGFKVQRASTVSKSHETNSRRSPSGNARTWERRATKEPPPQ